MNSTFTTITVHVYADKTVKGVILMVLALMGLFVFIMPHVSDEITWSIQIYMVVAFIWIVAWIVGIVDSARTCKEQHIDS